MGKLSGDGKGTVAVGEVGEKTFGLWIVNGRVEFHREVIDDGLDGFVRSQTVNVVVAVTVEEIFY